RCPCFTNNLLVIQHPSCLLIKVEIPNVVVSALCYRTPASMLLPLPRPQQSTSQAASLQTCHSFLTLLLRKLLPLLEHASPTS
ncbi:unnamed protein product, partial [Gulo gulo]